MWFPGLRLRHRYRPATSMSTTNGGDAGGRTRSAIIVVDIFASTRRAVRGRGRGQGQRRGWMCHSKSRYYGTPEYDWIQE